MARTNMPFWVLGGMLLLQAESAQAQETIHLKTFTVEDTTLRQPALTVLVPSDWKAAGRIHWRLHAIMPATGSLEAVGPNGVDGVRFYANIPFVDGVREAAARNAQIAGPDAMRAAAAAFPEGAAYLGNEVRRHAGSPEDYVTRILLPRQRPDVKEYKVVATENMPQWAKSSAYLAENAPGIHVTVQAARVRIAYADGAKNLHEDFFVLVPSVTIAGVVYWVAESASSVRAEAGKVDVLHKIHQTMLYSIKLDLAWYNKERQVSAMLQDAFYRQQRQIMELSRYIANTNDQISDMISKSYWDRQAVQDRMHTRFSEYIRGVQSYSVPNSRSSVQLPSGYQYNWVNNQGEYVQSNNPSFNPNQSLNGTWQQLAPAR